MQSPISYLGFAAVIFSAMCGGMLPSSRSSAGRVSEARWRSNRVRYHDLFKEAYNERLLQRVMKAQRAGTAVGRFATNTPIENVEQLESLTRKRRSPHMFSSGLTYKADGDTRLLYFSVDGAPGAANERSTIAAMFADWSAVTTVCFVERVSSHEPSHIQIRYVDKYAYRVGCNCNTKSRSYLNPSPGPPRLIDLNTDFTFLSNPPRPYGGQKVSLPATILHEVGHTLGVPETSSSASSAMNQGYNRYSTANFINSYERNRVQSIYGKCGGRTDAMVNILYKRNGELKRVTMVTRETAFWIYSEEHGRPERDFPIRLSQWFSRNGQGPIHNTYMKTMFQIYDGSQTGSASPPGNPEFYVVQGRNVHKYRYSHPRVTYTGISVTIYNFTKGAMFNLDAAFWDEKTRKLNIFYGNKVYAFNKHLDLLSTRRIGDAFNIPALNNADIDEAYQFVKNGKVALAFFRGLTVYAAGNYVGGWTMVSKGTVPGLSGGFGWHDLCDNLCG